MYKHIVRANRTGSKKSKMKSNVSEEFYQTGTRQFAESQPRLLTSIPNNKLTMTRTHKIQ